NVTTPIPEVYIFPNTTSGYAPLPVLLEGLASNSPTSWLWDFDDGTPPVTTMDATHTFANPGTYNVSLTATNDGGSDTAYEMITATGFGITASSGPNGNVTPAGETLLKYGDNQTYAITPITGYKVANVLVDGVSNGTISSYTFTNVQANHTISATFAIRTFNITATAGANGAIIPNGTVSVNYGASQEFTFVPARKNHTQTRVVDGVTTTYPPKIASPYTFSNVQDNHTISVTFASNAREQIFYDPFDITPASNGWTIVSTPDWQTSAPRNGTYSIRFRGSNAAGPDEAIHRSIPTTGYSDIQVQYRLQAQSLESGEYFTAQYSTNGGSSYTDLTRYNGVYAGNTTMFPIYTPATLPIAADNQASNFRVRVGIWASATNDYGWVDDVKVTGIPDYI
ncbi:MAG: PKD domain-containing protein, partial [Methanoregula sp.]|nr:PKD domain-containing protein [Methanoregula sp.]